MNVILCYPPKRVYPCYGQDKRWLPLGIASLGAYIRQELPEVKVTLLDLFEYTLDEAVLEIEKYKVRNELNLIGFTTFTEQRISVFKLCELLKHDDNVVTVIGGPHAFIMANQIAEHYPYVDHIMKGEGERSIVNLIKNYIDGRESKRIIEADIIHNLDDLPHCIDGFDLFANVPNIIEAEAPIVMSRGCTDYCSFCSTTKFWHGYRSRSAQNVFDEMMKYNQRYGITKFKFHDDASTADLDNWKALCRLIVDYKWEYEITARADQFDDELIDLLARSGCKQVSVGIESGNEALRNAMNKRLDMDIAKQNMAKLMAAGIGVNMLFIIGYPGESENTINETITLMREVQPSAWCCQPLMIFPGTKVYRDLVNIGWITDDYWLDDLPQPYYLREQTWDKIKEWVIKVQSWMKQTNILIAAPVHQDETTFKLYLDALRKLKMPPRTSLYKCFVLHNCEHLGRHINGDNEFFIPYNSDNTYSKDEKTHYWGHGNFKDVVKMKNEILRLMLEGKFDYIFFVDSDIILHPDTLEHLLNADKDIVAEVFWTKWNKEDPNQPILPNAWNFDQYNFSDDDLVKWKNPGLYRVGMTGACTLIKRKVVESGVNWSPIPNVSYSYWEDRAFCIRAAVHGFTIWLDTNVPARHLYRESELQEYLKGINQNA